MVRLPPLGVIIARQWQLRHPPPPKGEAGALKVAETLRAWMHAKQRRFFQFRSAERWKALLKTRRVGATAGGVRELVARALETPGFRATYCSKTNVDARDRAWTNDKKDGFLDLVRAVGETPPKRRGPKLEQWMLGGVRVAVRDQRMKLDFSNGSQIEVFGANNIGRQASKRGAAKHVFWVDEAQDFPGLDEFMAVLSPAIRDFGGEIWLTGTPGVDCAGLFFECTKDEIDGDVRPPGWAVHHIEVSDNPFFGKVIVGDMPEGGYAYFVEDNLAHDMRLSDAERAMHSYGPFSDLDEAERAAAKVRWEMTAGAEMREKNLRGDEPDFVREWRGRWVRADARYVYPVHAVPRHVLLYAPQRLRDNPLWAVDDRFHHHPPWYDHHAAVADLPRKGKDGRLHQWLFSLWMDFGFFPDPFAIVLWAFTPTLNDVYEMFSWKQDRVAVDDQSTYIKMLYDEIDAVVSFGGDSAGKKDDFEYWSRRLNLPLAEANKLGKNMLEELLANDIRRHAVHFRDVSPHYVGDDKQPLASPLLTEMRHLVYLPGKPGKTREVHKHRKVNGVVHGDHACFIAGTRISCLDGYRHIEDVQPGDLVMTRVGLRPVTAAFSVGIEPTWNLRTASGGGITGTHDHPIWTQRGWWPLCQLMRGDDLMPMPGLQSDPGYEVVDVRPTGLEERVYNLTVAGEHEYFANGILVSNCDAARYGFADLTHYLAKVRGERPPVGSREHYQLEAERVERDLEKREAQREAAMEEADELASQYSDQGGYQWDQ